MFISNTLSTYEGRSSIAFLRDYTTCYHAKLVIEIIILTYNPSLYEFRISYFWKPLSIKNRVSDSDSAYVVRSDHTCQ